MKNFDDWKSLTPAQMTNFYRRAGQCVTLSGKLEFEKIRGCLIDEISELERHVQETKMKGKYLPLSVWKSKGYDVQPIEQGADWKPSDLFLGGSYSLLLWGPFRNISFNTSFLLSCFSYR